MLESDWLGRDGNRLVDQHGRSVILRGVSLSGNCKHPVGEASHTLDSSALDSHRSVSFVGRPFPLEELDEHFSRLARNGWTFVRLVVPWEAIEHAGPGVYDDAFIDYIYALVSAMPRYGLRCSIDAHQDVWSRLSGGSGAPGMCWKNIAGYNSILSTKSGWTLELAGFSLPGLSATHAVHLHGMNLDSNDPPPSVWPVGMLGIIWPQLVLMNHTRISKARCASQLRRIEPV